MTTDTPAAELAALMDINFRPQTTGTALQRRFGGGGNRADAVPENNGKRGNGQSELWAGYTAIAYLDAVLSTAWRRAGVPR